MAQRGSVAGKRKQSLRCASVEERGFPKAVAGTQEKADLRVEVMQRKWPVLKRRMYVKRKGP